MNTNIWADTQAPDPSQSMSANIPKPALTVNVDVNEDDEPILFDAQPALLTQSAQQQQPLDKKSSPETSPKGSHIPTNIFVAGVPASWDDKKLRERFSEFGEIISVKMVPNRHYGFVMYRRPDSAHAAINATHLQRPTSNSPTLMHVSIAMHDEGVDDVPNERIFVRGLPQWTTRDHVKQAFAKFGNVVDCTLLMNSMGQCKGSAFVQYATEDEARAAIEGGTTARIENWDFELEIKYSETPEVRQLRQDRNRERQRLWGQHQTSSSQNTSTNTTPNAQQLASIRATGGFPSPPAAAVQMFPSVHLQLPPGLPHPGMPPPGVGSFPLFMSPMQSPSALPSPPGSFGAPVFPAPRQQVSMPGSMQIGRPMQQQQVSPPRTSPFSAQPPPQMPMQFQQPRISSPPGIVIQAAPQFPVSGDVCLAAAPLTEDLVRLLLQRYGAVDRIQAIDGLGTFAVRLADRNYHMIAAQQLNGTVFSTGHVLSVAIFA